MGRTRKHNRGLPRRVYIRNGSYYLVDISGRWHCLCRVSEGEPAMYAALAVALKGEPRKGDMRSALARFQSVHLPPLAYTTRKEYERNYEVIANEFEDFDVAQVQPRHIVKFLRLFDATPTARRQYKARLSTFFRWCVTEEGVRTDNPCSEVRVKTPPRHKTKWTDALFHAVREKLSDVMQCYHDLSFLLYQRTTDVRLLKHSQIGKDVIHFKPSKTMRSSGLEVDVPITPEIQAVLDRAAKLAKVQAGPGGDAFVIQTGDGDAFTRSGIYSAYMRADKALHGGKPIGLNPKSLRPYAATTATKQGFSKEQLQVALAHTSIATTEGYVHQHEVPLSPIALRPPKRGKD